MCCCKDCRYFKELPFADEYVCCNEESEYADCKCEPDDYCDEWEEED